MDDDVEDLDDEDDADVESHKVGELRRILCECLRN
jgi:hypothetical protein